MIFVSFSVFLQEYLIGLCALFQIEIMTDRKKPFNLIHYLRNEALRSNRWSVSRSRYLQHRFDRYSKLYSQDAKGHSGCVNALDFSSDGLLLATGQR